MSAVWVTRLRRTIDNGSCTLAALDGALRMRALTEEEHAELVAYWHEVNDPPAEEEPPVEEPVVEVPDVTVPPVTDGGESDTQSVTN